MQNTSFCFQHQGCDHPYSAQQVQRPPHTPHTPQVQRPPHTQLLRSLPPVQPLQSLQHRQRLQRTDNPSSMAKAEEGCTDEYLNIIRKRHVRKRDPNDLLEESCCLGDKDSVDYAIEMDAKDMNRGLYCAITGGFLEIVMDLVEHGATKLNEGLDFATENGHLEIVKYLVEHCATDLNVGLQRSMPRTTSRDR